MSRFKRQGGGRGSRKRIVRPSISSKQNLQENIHASQANVVVSTMQQSEVYDENLLECARTQWQFGDWDSLAQLHRETIEMHPERAKLALFAAAGHAQLGNSIVARQFAGLAREWGCDKRLIIRVFIGGVYNALGKAAAISQDGKQALKHFTDAVKGIGGDERLHYQARSLREITRLGLSQQAALLLQGEGKQDIDIFANDLSKPVIRTIHHFSCTGGTLFSKCLAAQTNVVVFNEIDPFSKLELNKTGKHEFAPRDIISLLYQSEVNIDNRLIADIFCSNIDRVINELAKTQKHLVLREHTHGAYLEGALTRNAPLLCELLADRFDIKSIVTVRNPIDSYLSMQESGWIRFDPPTFDEYCFRYLCFLDDYDGVKIFRYEDFVENSIDVMVEICRELDIEFNSDFINTFSEYKFSGDSGRSGSVIGSRARRSYNQEFVREVNGSENFKKVAYMLGYGYYLS